jgi:hypothetical protein
VITAAGEAGALHIARQYQLTATAYGRLYRDAFNAGLDRPRRIDQPVTPDAGILTITFLAAGMPEVTTVIWPERDDPQRRQIAAIRHRLQPTSWSRGDLAAAPADYRPDGLAVINTWSGPATANPGAPIWPLDPIDLGTPLHGGGLCSIYRGDRLGIAEQTARTAASSTRWNSGANAFYATFRPLLPGESDCAELAG